MDYAEFRLRIRSTCLGDYELAVEESPSGGATEATGWSLTAQDVQRLLAHAFHGEARRRELVEPDQEPPPAERPERVSWDRAMRRELGCFLFDHVFIGSVRERFTKALDEVRIHQCLGRGATALRLRLTFGAPGDSASAGAVAHLAALPWELLYSPDDGTFLSLNDETPVVRTVDVPGYLPPLEVDPPLKVLVIQSLPKDQDYLELGKEIANLGEHLNDTPLIQVELLENATFEALRQRLESETFHVLHYLGHGGAGRILLEDAAGRSDEVSTGRLGELLREHRSLRLAVLNACHSASLPELGSGQLFRGVATGLILSGLPAVVATQFSIGDAAAIDFADAFYDTIIRNGPLELAVTRGRRGIRQKALVRAAEALPRPDGSYPSDWWHASAGALEWATPVLYSRTAGTIFDVLPLVEVFGIRFRWIESPNAASSQGGSWRSRQEPGSVGFFLAERPLAEEDWDRIAGTSLLSEPVTIAAIEALFRESRGRARKEDERVAGLRLPSEDEIRHAYTAGGRGLSNGDLPYQYCSRDDPSAPWGAVKGDGPRDAVAFRFDGRDERYSPRSVVRPVVDLRPAGALGGESVPGHTHPSAGAPKPQADSAQDDLSRTDPEVNR